MTEPTTPAGQEMDLAWPGSHIDRLSWRKRIAAIEQQAAAAERQRLRERADLIDDLLSDPEDPS